MRDGSAQIPRGLFGYRRRAVIHVLEERDYVLRQLEERLKRADGRLAELEEKLANRNTAIAGLENDL